MRQLQVGSTSRSVELYIIDSTTGLPELGVLWNTAGIDLNYHREGAAVVAIAEADLTTPALTDAWETGGFLEIGFGKYRLDVPDAAFVAGADLITIGGTVTDMVVLPVDIQLVAFDPEDATDLGLASIADTLTAVGRLTSGTAAVNTTAESFTKSGAEPETNTYTATVAEDGVHHIVQDVGDATDAYYQFDVGGDGVPVSVTWWGYAQGQGDSYGIYAYNYITSDYEQIGTILGTAGTTAKTATFSLTNAHVGTVGAALGLVRFRFLSADGAAFATDRLLCSYAIVSRTTGYNDGSLWLDTILGHAGTENYVNATADHAALTWAQILTISASMRIKKVTVFNGSTVTLSGDSSNFTILGAEFALLLNGQTCDNLHVEHGTVSGVGVITAGEMHLVGCHVGTVTLGKAHLDVCGLDDTLTLSDAAEYVLTDCKVGDAGATPPIIDFGALVGDTTVRLPGWQGGLEIANLGATGTDVITIQGSGTVIIGATCVAGTISLQGPITITGAAAFLAAGGVINEDARYDVDQITEAVLEGVIADHSGVADSLAEHLERVRQLSEADVYLDQTTTPWTVVWALNGTGDEVAPTVLLRKRLYDAAGADIAHMATRIAAQSRD